MYNLKFYYYNFDYKYESNYKVIKIKPIKVKMDQIQKTFHLNVSQLSFLQK